MTRLFPVLTMACILAAGPGVTHALDLTIACGRTAQETALCKGAVGEWEAKTGHRVQVITTPTDDAQRLARYLDLLQVGAPELDVLEIDALWCGQLGAHLADLKPLIADHNEADHNPGDPSASDFLDPLIRNATLGERLVALPWYLELGLLYYRSDLLARYNLQVPRTWGELEDAARRIQEAQRLLGNTSFWGFAWPGGEDEALTATAIEWISSQGGGTLVEPDGRVSVNNPRAQFALQRAANWIRGITPAAALTATPHDNLDGFRAGAAGLMRNWSTAWTSLQDQQTPVAERIAVAPLPKGAGAPASVLGGGQLAVSRYSRHPTEAAGLVRYLTGAVVQRRRALDAGFNPTLADLYTDPELIAARPLLADLAPILPNLIARPSTPTGAQYPEVSATFAAAVRAVLRGDATPDAALTGLQRTLDALSQNGTAW
ncbi:ABC transporter substrate-binding protein [uncultured Lamprocystis sp.]|uniref:ABC transporter substrate-binding protein n=1 Tax=uncultured Lamprocystis sp. TaxID=543132 RepID=UPI0025FDC077|nr:ABC transporter substrate-binding protein [uncultured Lamprocystis sp.]